MAKKSSKNGGKKVASAAPAPLDPITCTGFMLTLNRDPGNAFEVGVTAFGPTTAGQRAQYGIHIAAKKNDQPDLIRAIVTAIAGKWPDYDWKFTGKDGEITGIVE